MRITNTSYNHSNPNFQAMYFKNSQGFWIELPRLYERNESLAPLPFEVFQKTEAEMRKICNAERVKGYIAKATHLRSESNRTPYKLGLELLFTNGDINRFEELLKNRDNFEIVVANYWEGFKRSLHFMFVSGAEEKEPLSLIGKKH